MFLNNYDNSEPVQENRNSGDVTIFDESIKANMNITCNVVGQGGLDQKMIQLNLYKIFFI